MALVSGQRSTLNPNALLFIPAAFRQVEDFSPEWWELVKTSTWFRDYWLSQIKEDDFAASAENVATEDDFPSLEAEFEELVFCCESDDLTNPPTTENEGKPRQDLNLDAKALLKDMFSSSPRHRATKSPGGSPKYYEKPVQHVPVRCSPRRIQQPR